MFKPEGVYVAMLTPFSDDGSINEAELRRVVDFLAGSGVHGLFPLGSVGESIHLSHEEKLRMIEIVVDQNRGRVQITPGVGSTYPGDAIMLAREAGKLGCEGVVVAPPYFFPLSQDMVEKYYETIADAVDVPIILYNIPLFSEPLRYDVVERLSRRQNVVGMKDSSGSMVDFLHFMDKTQHADSNFHLLTGREETLLPCLMMGAKGCVTGTSGILPEIMVGIFQAWKEGEYDKARVLQTSILPLIRAMFAPPFPLGFKMALELRGFNMGPPKQPLADAEIPKLNRAKSRIEETMKPLLEGIEKQAILKGK